MKLHYQNHLKPYAKKLRKAGNLAEVLLWRELKGNKLGCRFLRQVPIGNYIVDFYCHSPKVAIEIDGAATHNSKVGQDEKRQIAIEASGVKFLRFTDADVRFNLSSVVEAIKTKSSVA